MDSDSAQPQWWSKRLAQWQTMGYQTLAIEEGLIANPSLASETILLVERNISAAEMLRRDILQLDERYAKTAITWLDILDEPMSVESVQEEFSRFNLRTRPWVVDAKIAQRKWLDLGMEDDLEDIITRLDSLDPVFIAKGSLLGELFEEPDNCAELHKRIERLEDSQTMRWDNLEKMVIALHEKGINADEVMMMDLSTAYERVSKLEMMSEKLAAIRNEVEVGIFAYDPLLAQSLLARLEEIDIDSEEEFISMHVVVSSTISDLDVRYLKINNRVKGLTASGFILPPHINTAKEYLIQLEKMIEQLEERAAAHDALIGEAAIVAEIWPELNGVIHDVGGDLNRSEEIELAVAEARQRIKGIQIEAEEQVSRWSDLGFDMSAWRNRFDKKPVEAMGDWTRHLPALKSSLELIRRLEELDTTMGASSRVEEHVSALQAANIEAEVLEYAEDFLQAKGIRNKRHRRMLEKEIKELFSKGQIEGIERLDSLKLVDLEELVHSTTREVGLSPTSSERGIIRLPVNAIQNEMDGWKAEGWNISGMELLLHKEPLTLGRMIDGIREDIHDHCDLVRRLERLPLAAAPATLARVEEMIDRPDRLSSLRMMIPELAAKAAFEAAGERGGHELWRPYIEEEEVPVAEELEDMDVEVLHAAIEEMYSYSNNDSDLDTKPAQMLEEEFDAQPAIIEPVAELKSLIEEKTETPVVEEDKTLIEKEVTISTEVKSETPIVEENEKNSAEDDSSELDILVKPLNKLLELLGLDAVVEDIDSEVLDEVRFGLADEVGIQPRDSRVDRLLRLALRLLPRESTENIRERAGMISMLAGCAERLDAWCGLRLEHRNTSVQIGLLQNSRNLGKTLSRIPGPGTTIPLEADEYQLPAADDLIGLAKEVAILSKHSNLAGTSGIKAY